MGLEWSLSAAIATFVLLFILGAIYNKAKDKKDSPLYKIAQKLKRKKQEDTMIDETIHYKRLSHKSGVKW
jgi:hypothetical protein